MAITFKEFSKGLYEEYKELPHVQFDISPEKHVLEEAIGTDMTDHFLEYVSDSEHDTPESRGYQFHHFHTYKKEGSDKVYVFKHSNTPTEFDNISDALDHVDAMKAKHVEDIDSHAKVLRKHYDQNKFSIAHINAVNNYTQAFSSVNRAILNNGGDVSKLVYPHTDTVKHLDSALRRFHTPDHLVVYSGTDDAHAKLLRTNDVVHHPAYMSTSLSHKTAFSFAKDKGGDLVKLHVPAEHIGLYPGHMSSIPSEREFIIPRGHDVRIDHSKRQYAHVFEGSPANRRKVVVAIHHAYLVPKE